MAQQIPEARLIELPGSDHFPWLTNADVVLGEIEEFLTGTRQAREPDRVLATVLFTDIVDSTQRAVEMGDQSWHRVLDEHDRTARSIVEKYRSLVKTTGDGMLATFDGPGRAIRCALDFETAAAQIGLSLRAGLHTGEFRGWVDAVEKSPVTSELLGFSFALAGMTATGRTIRPNCHAPYAINAHA